MADPVLVLPGDLVAFLRDSRQLNYDASKCEAGQITLLPLDKLRIQRFPTDTQSSSIEDEDPHRGELGCYLVRAVNLVASCTGDYDPVGLLLWFPNEKRFGTWDSSHACLAVLAPEVGWEQIVEAPWRAINSQWIGAYADSLPAEPLRPWPTHEFSAEQIYEPIDPTSHC